MRPPALALVLLAALPACARCGAETPAAAPVETAEAARVVTEEALAGAISAARTRAEAGHRRVLLAFVGSGDADTRLVLRLLGEPAASASLARGYELVWVNLGPSLEGQPRLRHAHDVDAVVTLVVLDPASGRRAARRVFAPVSGHGTVTSATLAAWLDDPRGR